MVDSMPREAAATSPKIIHLIAMNFHMYFSSYLAGIHLAQPQVCLTVTLAFGDKSCSQFMLFSKFE
jgi:hypothetical protein